ncbi:hypothetical protein MMC22_002923 [Lobaria immixta]|nr:hypothetical protein [Lobaria immixta]
MGTLLSIAHAAGDVAPKFEAALRDPNISFDDDEKLTNKEEVEVTRRCVEASMIPILEKAVVAGTGEGKTLLNLQFHDEAYDPVGHIVYEDKFKYHGEVIAVEELVKSLVQMGKKYSKICVSTGYVQQEDRIRALALSKQWSDVTISTIGTVQGREWDIVILSLVQTSGDPGFIGSLERVNVACSRQRHALYLIGKWEFWKATHKTGIKYMGRLVQRMLFRRGEAFVVQCVFIVREGGQTNTQGVKNRGESSSANYPII